MTSKFFDTPTETSRRKIQIVTEYFATWSQIMLGHLSDAEAKIAYIDLFAGKGYYNDKTPSTPIRILLHAISKPELAASLIVLLNDGDPETAKQLQENIDKLPGINKLKYPPVVTSEKLERESDVAKVLSSKPRVPALLFVDPYGYQGLTLDLINSVLKDFGTDCVFLFNFNRINAAIANSKVADHVEALFGQKRADLLRMMATQIKIDRKRLGKDAQKQGALSRRSERRILTTLREALTEKFAKYVLTFRFLHEHRQGTSHHLIFVTKHPKGYGVMQPIMAKQSSDIVQEVPSFEFVPPEAQGNQLMMQFETPLDDLIADLPRHFRGKQLAMKEIWLEHSSGTNYIAKNYKTALWQLLDKNKITSDRKPGRKNTFADEIVATFPVFLRCPLCHKSFLLGTACRSCNQTSDDEDVIAQKNENDPPDDFGYATEIQTNNGCCSDSLIELGNISDGLCYPQFVVCMTCGHSISQG